MDLINKKVIHEVFGEGKILEKNDDYLKIQFGDEEKTFLFPNAFESFLKFKSAKDAERLLPNIKKKFLIRQKEEEEHQEQVYKERMIRIEEYRAERDSKSNSKSKSRRSVQETSNIAFRLSYGDGVEEWKAYAGLVLRGDNQGKPKTIGRALKNTLCILTACDEDASEDSRYIYGVFLVDEVFKGDKNQEGYVGADDKYRIKLSKEEANKILFWNYYANATNPQRILWNSGLFRYFHNTQAAQILKAIAELKKGTEDEELAKDFYEQFCSINRINSDLLEEPKGALKQTETVKK